MDSAQTTSSAGSAPLSTVDNKIAADLNTVNEKMDLLDSMIKPGGAESPVACVQTSEALLTVIGFLEACAPRMIELVEAAAQGALSGSVLEQCLSVNDRLLKQLKEIDSIVLSEKEAATAVASAAAPPVDDMAAFTLDDLEDDGDHVAAAPAAGAKSTGEEDLFGDGTMLAEDTKPAAAAPAATDILDAVGDLSDVADKDSFDDFFAERTAAQPKEGEE